MKRDDTFLYEVNVRNHTCGEAPCEDRVPLVVLQYVLGRVYRSAGGRFEISKRRGGEVFSKYVGFKMADSYSLPFALLQKRDSSASCRRASTLD